MASTIPVIDTSIKADPYELYARLRAEAPVCRVAYGSTRSPVWMVTRYDDVITVLKDTRFKNDREAAARRPPLRFRVLNRLFSPLLNNMLNRDQPDHGRLRGLVHQAFTPKRVENLRRRLEELTDDLVTRGFRQWPWDLVADYAAVIPTTIIAEMLGIPAGDREKFRGWSNALLQSSATTWKGMAANLPGFVAFTKYLKRLIAERRSHPEDDLISALIAAEEAGDKLASDELLAMVFLLLIAGFETTMNLIGNGTLALLENPAEMDRLAIHPALMASAVEEFARYYSPVEFSSVRYAAEDVTLADTVIPKGHSVVAAISSANRDESQFRNPETLNIAREPNRHLGFGMGIHYCLGAPLARLEAQVAFRTLLDRTGGLQMAVHRERLQWRNSTLSRGLEALPVRLVHKQRALRTSA